MAKFKDTAVEPFLDALASQAATPGGGSAAAIMGAMGAALVSMVCNLTIGKKKYAEVETEMKDVLAKSEALRAKLTGMIEDDVKAFDAVMARSEEHTSELQSLRHLVCRLLLEK